MFSLPSLRRLLPSLAALALACLASPALAQDPAARAPLLPDPQLTPGDTFDVSLADLQERGYSAKVRNVPVAEKRAVYASYGIAHWNPGEYEVDHLIPLSLGGSNSKKNLWPESYLTSPWNAHVKDQLEYKLLMLVRAGKVDLRQAQQEIASDWIAAYKRYVSPVPLAGRATGGRAPRRTGRAAGDASTLKDEQADTETATAADAAPAAPAEQPAAPGQVWVNTKSGVIWRPGTRYYGKTAQGRYMGAEEALAAGYHYAR